MAMIEARNLRKVFSGGRGLHDGRRLRRARHLQRRQRRVRVRDGRRLPEGLHVRDAVIH